MKKNDEIILPILEYARFWLKYLWWKDNKGFNDYNDFQNYYESWAYRQSEKFLKKGYEEAPAFMTFELDFEGYCADTLTWLEYPDDYYEDPKNQTETSEEDLKKWLDEITITEDDPRYKEYEEILECQAYANAYKDYIAEDEEDEGHEAEKETSADENLWETKEEQEKAAKAFEEFPATYAASPYQKTLGAHIEEIVKNMYSTNNYYGTRSQHGQRTKCNECGGFYRHKKSCSKYKAPSICPECKGKNGKHFKFCSKYDYLSKQRKYQPILEKDIKNIPFIKNEEEKKYADTLYQWAKNSQSLSIESTTDDNEYTRLKEALDYFTIKYFALITFALYNNGKAENEFGDSIKINTNSYILLGKAETNDSKPRINDNDKIYSTIEQFNECLAILQTNILKHIFNQPSIVIGKGDSSFFCNSIIEEIKMKLWTKDPFNKATFNKQNKYRLNLYYKKKNELISQHNTEISDEQIIREIRKDTKKRVLENNPSLSNNPKQLEAKIDESCYYLNMKNLKASLNWQNINNPQVWDDFSAEYLDENFKIYASPEKETENKRINEIADKIIVLFPESLYWLFGFGKKDNDSKSGSNKKDCTKRFKEAEKYILMCSASTEQKEIVKHLGKSQPWVSQAKHSAINKIRGYIYDKLKNEGYAKADIDRALKSAAIRPMSKPLRKFYKEIKQYNILPN